MKRRPSTHDPFVDLPAIVGQSWDDQSSVFDINEAAPSVRIFQESANCLLAMERQAPRPISKL
jgi:hypothetical protein